jgi:hypothetical protein
MYTTKPGLCRFFACFCHHCLANKMPISSGFSCLYVVKLGLATTLCLLDRVALAVGFVFATVAASLLPHPLLVFDVVLAMVVLI